MAITPYLLYQDAGAAIEWLARAFGLRESGISYKDEEGRVTHAEMRLGEAVLMLGSPGRDFKNPKLLGAATLYLYVDVADVDRHHARAVQAGATIIEEPKDTFYGARRYGAEDPEGHRWFFAEDRAQKRKRAKNARRKATRGKAAKGRGRKPSARK